VRFLEDGSTYERQSSKISEEAEFAAGKTEVATVAKSAEEAATLSPYREILGGQLTCRGGRDAVVQGTASKRIRSQRIEKVLMPGWPTTLCPARL
jgi:hypothetical protein